MEGDEQRWWRCLREGSREREMSGGREK